MKHSAFWLLTMLLINLTGATAQKTNSTTGDRTAIISGSCWDIATGVDLKAKITALVNGQQKTVGESNNEGRFEIAIPVATSSLTFDAKGYRSITEAVYIDNRVEKSDRFVLSLRMIALDSEQVVKDAAVLKDNQAAQNGESPTTNFEVRDAYLGKPLTAKICMTFPRTNRSYCLDTDSASAPFVSFVGELENIDIKVTAEGYRDYEGKLKQATTSSGGIFYQIKLLKKITPMAILSFGAPENLNIEYKIGDAFLPFVTGRPWKNIYFEREALGEQSVTATIAGNGPVLSEQKFNVKPGLNLISVKVEAPENKLEQIIVKAKQTPRKTDASVTTPIAPSSTLKTFENTMLYFDQSSYILRPASKLTLDSVSEFLVKQNNMKALITGHTDNVGKQDLNLILSEYRARVVAQYLRQKGVQPGRISLKWSGSSTPAASNDIEENKMKNRRVVVQIIENQQ